MSRADTRNEVIGVLVNAPELAGATAEQARAIPFGDLAAAIEATLVILEVAGVNLELPPRDAAGLRAARTFVLADQTTYRIPRGR